jgi:hypothetical protein
MGKRKITGFSSQQQQQQHKFQEVLEVLTYISRSIIDYPISHAHTLISQFLYRVPGRAEPVMNKRDINFLLQS